MQVELKAPVQKLQNLGSAKALLLSSLIALSFSTVCQTALLAKAPAKKPKGFVHDTAGDGAAQTSAASYSAGGTPKWIQYDMGGLYYYQRNETEKARQYWMEALKEAEVAVPRERPRGLSARTIAACCRLIEHLCYFNTDSKYRQGLDSSFTGITQNKVLSSPSASANPAQFQLDNMKLTLRQYDRDWEWYERVCAFANRAIGRQRDCMRNIYNQRSLLERKIVQTRMAAQDLEERLGIPLANSAIDTRPLKWDGVPGGGNPFDTPGSNPTPIEYRGGKRQPPPGT